MFVHLTAEKNLKAILRNGISRMRKTPATPGIFAMPVTRNFYVSHQWLRELKRSSHGGMIAGVYFRIPDDQNVLVGHYNQPHQNMTATQAAALISSQANPEGYQVIVPRRVEKGEIHRVRVLPQIVGWRYQPGAHGKKPCPCPICVKGNFGARKIRIKFD